MRVIDVDQTSDHIKQNPGFCFGVKVRMHVNAVAYWNAHEAMKAARDVADKSGTRLMVHVSGTPIPLPDVLEFLGPGDISTHAFNGHPEHMAGPEPQDPAGSEGRGGPGCDHGPGPRWRSL